MMVTTHALTGIATSLLFAKKIGCEKPSIKICASAFLFNIALHGFMDILPHGHYISSVLDIGIALLLILLLSIFLKKEYLWLVVLCWLGSIFPDFLDLGVLRVLELREFKLFPWHYLSVYNFLDNIYTNSLINMAFDILILSICLGIALINNNLKAILRIN